MKTAAIAGRTYATALKIVAIGARTSVTRSATAAHEIAWRIGSTGGKIGAIGARTSATGEKIAAIGVRIGEIN